MNMEDKEGTDKLKEKHETTGVFKGKGNTSGSTRGQ
jgi:hypothetical protein